MKLFSMPEPTEQQFRARIAIRRGAVFFFAVAILALAATMYLMTSGPGALTIHDEETRTFTDAYRFARELEREMTPLVSIWRVETREVLTPAGATVNGAGILDPPVGSPSPYTSAFVQIPNAASLRFEAVVVYPEGVPRPDPVTFRVAIETRDGVRRTIHERRLTPRAEREPNRWNEATIDLREFAGQRARFIFETDSQGWLRGRQVAQALWGAPVLTAPTHSESSTRPNVILISIDTLRADLLGCYGSARDTSPYLDALAAEANLFEHCYSPSSWTLPAHVAVLTGLHPSAHGSNSPTGKTIPSETPTLAELATLGGYRTAAFTGGVFVAPQWGFGRGFERYGIYRQSRTGDAIGDSLSWMADAEGTPFFVFLHTYTVHEPYSPPPEYLEKFGDPEYTGPMARQFHFDDRDLVMGLSEAGREHLKNLYTAEIGYVDSLMGYFFGQLKKRGLWDNSLIVVFSDHGEEFWDHGQWGHGVTLYDEQLHVPLLIKMPNQREGRRIDTLVSLTDLFMTTVNAINPKEAVKSESLDLTPLMTGDANSYERAYVVGEVGFREDPWARIPAEPVRKSIRSAEYKFILNPGDRDSEFYNLIEDPHEHSVVPDGASPAQDTLRHALERFSSGAELEKRVRAAKQETVELDDLSADLEALGYL